MTEKLIVYPNGVDALRLPSPERNVNRKFVQFYLGEGNELPVFFFGRKEEGYTPMRGRFGLGICPYPEYSGAIRTAGMGKIIRPSPEEVSLYGDKVSKEHLASLADLFPMDTCVFLDTRLIIRNRRFVR